jgi:pyridoxamine 5'-phosphate oxidase family protein
VSVSPWRVRCLEIRRHGEALESPGDSASRFGGPIIRVHPERIISFGIHATHTAPHDAT